MDDTVVELLRPLLRDWLDTNMPRLIEPALKAELEALRGVDVKGQEGLRREVAVYGRQSRVAGTNSSSISSSRGARPCCQE